MTLNEIKKGAAINGVVNAVINGIINWFTLDKRHPSILLTQDQISSTAHTVFSGAVPLAISLAFILTSIAFFQTKVENKPSYFPTFFVKALKHSVYAFGLVVIFAILLQRIAGEVEVSLPLAAIIAGIIAGIVAAIVDFETKKSLFENKK
ncbi:hypothetical protein C943_03831 [Mariniradius saccharolyticus AK6]|uniref:Uncharacterized protein n=1 Tax=Mariniradius saccharolyticus AK6 TaxID=1239962 RepID=M7X9C7_9BACT|nr:hypothetical protein [Mariniradius saccharolyticus]EMS34015.1 hypothetical protein C943_03831 [Mariniradius saccharolyticus AK6]